MIAMHYQLPPPEYSLISSFKLEIETPSLLGPNYGNSEKLLHTTSFPGISGLSGGLCIASTQGPWVDSVIAGLKCVNSAVLIPVAMLP